MNILSEIRFHIFMLFLLLSGLLVACSGPASVTSPQAVKPPSAQTQAPTPPAAIPKSPTELLASRVEIVYFHMPMRCATCLCFEERADYVVKTYFQNELASDKLTFKICQIGEKQNVALVSKYNALGSQLFVNMVINNVDHIKDIQDIWDWHCTGDEKSFDEKVSIVIRQSLEAVK